MYQALYRKWRPRTFDDVVGQRHITETLKRQVQTGRLSHAYLFTGTRGTGKTTCAKILARAVNCQQPREGNPCNQCPACQGIENGSILDVLELDAASNNRVDDIRAILDEAVYTPATVKKRVYIVDEVHMLSQQAFNALLQILEEPPAHLMFILATTEINKVPATIKSRCQQFAFKRIHADEIAARLRYVAEQEGIQLTAEGAQLIARLADGGMRDALSLLDQCAGEGGVIDENQVRAVLGLAGNLETAALLDAVAQADGAQALERLDRLYAGGKDMAALAGELASLVRDLLVRRTAPETGAALTTGGYDEGTMRRLERQFEIPRLVQMLRALQETGAGMNRSANRRTDMELCLVTLCDPALDPSPVALAARVARLEQEGVPAPAQSAGAPSAPEGKELPPKTQRGEPLAHEAVAPAQPAPAAPAAGREREPAVPADSRTPAEEMAPAEKAAPAEEPAPAAPARAGNWPGWAAFREQLKSAVSVADFSFLGNPAMVCGSWDGHELTLWADSDFIRSLVDKPPIVSAVGRMAQQVMGCPARVTVRTGKPPEQGDQAGEESPLDALDAFLSDNEDSVIVE